MLSMADYRFNLHSLKEKKSLELYHLLSAIYLFIVAQIEKNSIPLSTNVGVLTKPHMDENSTAMPKLISKVCSIIRF